MTVLAKVKSVIKHISVEPVFFAFGLCSGLNLVVSSDLYIAKVCNVNYGFNSSICDNIQGYKDEQTQVQKHVATLNIYDTVLNSVPSMMFTLFAGPWSDHHGRKPLLILTVFGQCLHHLVFLINSYFFKELKAEFLLFEVS